MAGQVQMSFDTMASVIRHIKNGKVRALAVATRQAQPAAAQRADAGRSRRAKGVEMSAWYGIYMPTATPKAVQERVHDEVNKLLAMPETKTRLEAIGAEITPMTQVQFAAFHGAENKRYARHHQEAQHQARLSTRAAIPTNPSSR